MALQKQSININFAGGLDLKTDPNQVTVGNFLSLQNSVFTTGGRLTKRNGNQTLASLPAPASLSTTFNGGLTAIGTSLQSYSSSANDWINKGNLELCQLEVLELIRSGTNQSQADTALAANGLLCTVYTDNIPDSGSNVPVYKYAISDSSTGQNIIIPTVIPAQSTGAVTGSPRVFLLGAYFVIVFTNVVSGTSALWSLAISTSMPTNPPIETEITTSYVSATTLSWDGIVYGNYLYIGYNSTTGGQNISFRTLSNNLAVSAAKTFTGSTDICTIMSMCVDATNPSVPIIWAAFYNLGTTTAKVTALSANLNTALAPTTLFSSGTILNMTCTAQNGSVNVFYEVSNTYSFSPNGATNYIDTIACTVSGTVGSATTVVRSVGLASKAALLNGSSYFVGIFSSPYQPSYFLFNAAGKVLAKFAYSNGGTYYTVGLPSINVNANELQMAYFFADQIQALNKVTATVLPTPFGIYSQTGINLATITFGDTNVTAAEIGGNLNISGGFITSFDGVAPTENGFFVWPEGITTTIHSSGGSIAVAQYYYQVTYEWTDNAGNLFRSAPSIPVGADVSSGSGSASVTLNIPTLRLTYKTANPVNIVIYRWSASQQIYYQITSITIPLQNDPTMDSVAFVDISSDADILGDNIIYTNGGVLENICPPASNNLALFNNRLWLVDAEDPNLLWYSQLVIEDTPVQMTDLLTQYIAPATGAQSSTGPITAIAPMDDKLVIWKESGLGYINGVGPDATGANDGYSDFVIINSVIGCLNQKSVVLTPLGLIFQTNKGIWLLGRDLSTQYIGAPVENLVLGNTVVDAKVIPNSTQVRIDLDTGIRLMYDYYYQKWGTFTGLAPVTGTIFEELDTFFDKNGNVYQESPGTYLDGSNPVLMSFQTGWITLNALQGYQRAYQFSFLGTYFSPHMLNIGVSYDYVPNVKSVATIAPNNFSGTYGQATPFGNQLVYGGPSSLEQWRIFFSQQRCQSIQISVQEIYDARFGTVAGEGLNISGMNIIIGAKNNHRPFKAINSVGAT